MTLNKYRYYSIDFKEWTLAKEEEINNLKISTNQHLHTTIQSYREDGKELVGVDLVFDVDCDILEKSQDQALKIYNYLAINNFPKGAIEIYFSGSKGFHIIVKWLGDWNDYALSIMHLMYQRLARKIKYAYKIYDIDMAIYSKRKMLRQVNTVNPKSGLYKIQLKEQELKEYTIDDIKRLATTKRYLPPVTLDKARIFKCFTKIFNTHFENDWERIEVNKKKQVKNLDRNVLKDLIVIRSHNNYTLFRCTECGGTMFWMDGHDTVICNRRNNCGNIIKLEEKK